VPGLYADVRSLLGGDAVKARCRKGVAMNVEGRRHGQATARTLAVMESHEKIGTTSLGAPARTVWWNPLFSTVGEQVAEGMIWSVGEEV